MRDMRPFWPWARATSGHATAEPPANEMKSRRLVCALKSRGQTYHIVGEPKNALKRSTSGQAVGLAFFGAEPNWRNR